MKSIHRIKLDIFKVSYRICRPYQEKIDDFYEDGKIRFQWDMIKQAHLLGNDTTLPAVCTSCPLNIYCQAEGCQGEILGMNIFLRVLSRIKPDASLFQYSLLYDVLDIEATRRLYQDITETEGFLEKLKWPIAQVFYGSMPVSYDRGDGTYRFIFYEWEGEEEETYPQGSEGYFWGRSQEGIAVKDNFGNRMPYIFSKIYKEGFGVYGLSLDGMLHAFVPVMGHFPSWDDIDPRRNSELVATEAPASMVFKDTIDTLKIFAQEAMKHNTGLVFECVG
ncbi:MAG: hypothetical protein RDV48_16965 [Candidatus Eremiobacteraeota bacterium]|nr:hypothetical protein [Candidatus Eremiobacteraeota bacterium]